MDRTAHPEDPAEGATDIDGAEPQEAADAGRGDPSRIPEHNTAPDGVATADQGRGEAVQGDASRDREAPLGGHETTRDQLEADNEVEEDTLKTLDPDDPPA